MSNPERPFRILGWHLKLAREQLKQTMGEVSGAVEIDSKILELIEQGQQRPTEEVLALLISHFEIAEVEANSLWELAGYNDSTSESRSVDSLSDKTIIMALSLDNRVVYTDQANISSNEYGVVMNFLQSQNTSGQPQPVARVGMSKEQAKRVFEMLKRTLEPQQIASQELKLLPKPTIKKPKASDKKS